MIAYIAVILDDAQAFSFAECPEYSLTFTK